MGFNMRMSTKIGASFLVLTMLVVICGAAGYYGVSRLSESLEYVTGPAWDAADGAMEGSIGTQTQMLAGEEMFAGLETVAVVRKEIAEGEKMANEALERMAASGLLSDADIRRVSDVREKYDDVKNRVINLFEAYDTVNKRLETNFFALQSLMSRAEELGDGAVEVLEQNPNLKMSWNSGLEEKWGAADGAMETQIGLMRKIYFYTRLVSFKDESVSLTGIKEAQEMIDEASSRMISHPDFKREIVSGGVYAGQSYSRALSQSIASNQKDFSEAVEKFQVYAKVREEYEGVTAKLLDVLELTEAVGDGKVEDEMAKIESVISFSAWMIIVVSIGAVMIAVVLGSLILRGVNQQLGGDPSELMMISDALANGNLDMKMNQNAVGVYGSIYRTVEKLIEVIAGIKYGSNEVHVAAEQVSVGNANLSQRTEEQASSLEETASSMEEMTSTVKQNADNADQASQLAQNARDQAETGGQVVSQAVQAMAEINASSSKIADIISVVEEIAFQTNLLALNAAVEAARAGEQGRGFAVVASEVRVLAGRSADAAKEIKNLIEDSVAKVKAGTDLVDKSGETLEEIVTGVKKVTDIVFEIAAASREQSSGIDQVNKAVTQMDEMTQQNASLVEEASAASMAMGTQAQKLNDLVSFFKLDESKVHMHLDAAPARQVHQLGNNANAPHISAAKPAALQQPTVKRQAAGGENSWEDF